MPRVLVVDDDLNLRTLLQVLLTRAGFDPEFAEDGDDALSRLHTNNYDAVLLDLLLPRLTGLNVLRAMNDEASALLPRTVIISAAPESTIDKARDFPVHAVVRKPFEIGELVHLVRACADKACI